MKKWKIILPILLIGVVLSLFFILKPKKQVFELEEKYYGENKITEIEGPELEKLINEKESFAIFVYQPMCITSSDFESVLNEFLKENKISIYKIAFSKLKELKVGDKINYYPSFILFENGKRIDFLEANKNEDLRFYESKEGFKDWFTKYIHLKEVNKNSSVSNETEAEETPAPSKNVHLENVKKEKNKVNIYFFWGDGCPHCEEEFKFFESIKEDYGKLYNLYPFEVWYNKENKENLELFARQMNDTIKGVPYTIIGNQTFKGFKESYKEELIKAIETESKKDFDVYFDKIKE